MKRLTLALLLFAGCSSSEPAPISVYDLVLENGRVIDPETKLDAVRNVGINGGKIAIVTDRSLTSANRLAANGMVGAPGFIDLHSHGQDAANYALKAADGVTTALELE